MGADRLQPLRVLRRGRNNQLAAIAMRDAVIGAVTVERLLAGNAHPRHLASSLVIDSGVDHFAVSRRGHGADAFGGFQYDHFAPGHGQPPGYRETHDPRADDDAFDPVHAWSEAST